MLLPAICFTAIQANLLRVSLSSMSSNRKEKTSDRDHYQRDPKRFKRRS